MAFSLHILVFLSAAAADPQRLDLRDEADLRERAAVEPRRSLLVYI